MNNTTERNSLGNTGETHLVEITKTYEYPNGTTTLRSYKVELSDGTRSKTYLNHANALKAWSKAFTTDKVVK